jgi:hypothetical protein
MNIESSTYCTVYRAALIISAGSTKAGGDAVPHCEAAFLYYHHMMALLFCAILRRHPMQALLKATRLDADM